jgi:anhydro-N-acetylmuramic acid kinase
VRTSRLERAAGRSERLCVGLISGTSADAAEAALCRIRGTGDTVELSLLAHRSLPFEPALTRRIQSVATVRELSELDFLLGERFAQATLAVISAAGLTPEQVDVVGSHGQTVAHLPARLAAVPSTLQIGEAAVIAERTGIPTVCDFRARDMAAGGEGAPLVPYFDWAVLRRAGVHRAFQNIGGIANLSVVSDRLEDTIAFDTGPGNMILDELALRATDGALGFDRDGELSVRGQPIPGLLEELCAHPFLFEAPPKSAGREIFGGSLVDELWHRHGDRPFDLLATAAAFTVEATARAYERFVFPRFPQLEGVYLSGGGTRNPGLLGGLQRRLSPVRVEPVDVLGFPEPAKEAACFALLASEYLSYTPQNVPSATGAKRAVVMGKMVP